MSFNKCVTPLGSNAVAGRLSRAGFRESEPCALRSGPGGRRPARRISARQLTARADVGRSRRIVRFVSELLPIDNCRRR